MPSITTDDGYTLRMFRTAYVDYGFAIEKGHEVLFSSPHYLSADSYGRKPHPRFSGDYEEAERWELTATPKQQQQRPAFVLWTSDDWKACLREQADDLIEGAVGGSDV